MSKYKIVRELGHNHEGGRITHLATDTSFETPLKVVIKEFRFAVRSANWSGFKAHEREIEFLRELEHPRIAKYLDSFETKSGFCLVQEYKNAPSLAQRRSFKPEEIKQIAVSVLEILVYLQKRTPPIIHRDIKPENILVDRGIPLRAYLIDFGFARIRDGELALSSVAAGTPGFMPPEEQFGRTLTEASDLYSLGATLICLLTGTRSVDIGKLIDDNYRFNFKGKLGHLNPRFVAWLEKMVAPNVKQRFPNAAAALEALKPIEVVGTNWRERLVDAVKGRKLAPVLGLASLGVVAWVGGTAYTQGVLLSGVPAQYHGVGVQDNVRLLQKTKECPRCNLSKANLSKANLSKANLINADLNSANLNHANLYLANLTYTTLNYARLDYARLDYARLDYANLSDASLYYTDLNHANLSNVVLNHANLIKANLSYAQLNNISLNWTYLDGANLSNTNLSRADLVFASLISANLSHANLNSAKLGSSILQNANLSYTNLDSADLGNANLNYADLSGSSLHNANLAAIKLHHADLRNANLKGVNLTGVNLSSANLSGAIMPDGSKHP